MARPPTMTAAACRAADQLARDRFGMPTLLLMENAGRIVAEEVLRVLRRHGRRGGIVVVCGPGNNGGDGLVAARYLSNAEVPVTVAHTVPWETYGGDAALNATIVRRMGIPALLIRDVVPKSLFRRAAVVVDALFGTGLSRHPSGIYAVLIDRMNGRSRAGVPVVAVDVPSGLDADTGRPIGRTAVRAHCTVTMGWAKPGMLRPCARTWCGRIVVADIGHPRRIAAMLSSDRGGRGESGRCI